MSSGYCSFEQFIMSPAYHNAIGSSNPRFGHTNISPPSLLHCTYKTKLIMAATSQETSVAVVGAGPVGLYTALLLGRAGIDVTLYESRDSLIDFPRAIMIHRLVLEDFKKTGVYDDVIDRSFVNTEGGVYCKPGGEILVSIDGSPDHPIVHCSQDRVQDVLFKHLQQQPTCKIIFNATLQTLEQSSDVAVLNFINDGKPLQVRAKLVVGADGSKSTVRKQLGLPLDGFTWTDNIRVATDIDYDLKDAGLRPAAFVVDPVYYASICRLGKGRGVRFDTGEPWPESRDGEWDEEEAKARVRHRLSRIIGPSAAQAPIIRMAMYRAHQRCVPNFVKGRVALAGDAAHLTNPTGGLGLTSDPRCRSLRPGSGPYSQKWGAIRQAACRL
ncbi:hypothetical protein V2G26_000341 [Clonostachys chloroleuca]